MLHTVFWVRRQSSKLKVKFLQLTRLSADPINVHVAAGRRLRYTAPNSSHKNPRFNKFLDPVMKITGFFVMVFMP